MRKVCLFMHFCIFEYFCELLSPFQTVVRVSIVIPLLKSLMMYLTSPAVSMSSLNWYQNLTAIQGKQEVRYFPSCTQTPPPPDQARLFDRWPTHRYIRVLRRAFQVTEMQAYHRVFAPSRRDQDRERILVLPRLLALPQWPLPPLWCSWISASELKSFLLNMCIDAPESTTNSRSSRNFEVGASVALASIGE